MDTKLPEITWSGRQCSSQRISTHLCTYLIDMCFDVLFLLHQVTSGQHTIHSYERRELVGQYRCLSFVAFMYRPSCSGGPDSFTCNSYVLIRVKSCIDCCHKTTPTRPDWQLLNLHTATREQIAQRSTLELEEVTSKACSCAIPRPAGAPSARAAPRRIALQRGKRFDSTQENASGQHWYLRLQSESSQSAERQSSPSPPCGSS